MDAGQDLQLPIPMRKYWGYVDIGLQWVYVICHLQTEGDESNNTRDGDNVNTLMPENDDNWGKRNDENNGMPARSINIYDNFTVNSYIFILYGRGYHSDEGKWIAKYRYATRKW